MTQEARARRKEKQEKIREEWFSLHLLDQYKKTPEIRSRMRTLYRQFMEVR